MSVLYRNELQFCSRFSLYSTHNPLPHIFALNSSEKSFEASFREPVDILHSEDEIRASADSTYKSFDLRYTLLCVSHIRMHKYANLWHIVISKFNSISAFEYCFSISAISPAIHH